MNVKLFVTKPCSDKFSFRENFCAASSLGIATKADGGECGNTLAVYLELPRGDAPCAIKLLTENGFKAIYA